MQKNGTKHEALVQQSGTRHGGLPNISPATKTHLTYANILCTACMRFIFLFAMHYKSSFYHQAGVLVKFTFNIKFCNIS